MRTIYNFYLALSLLTLPFLSKAESLTTQQDTIPQAQVSEKEQSPVGDMRTITFDPFGKNLQDTTRSKFQFSFVPYVGTQGTASGQMINTYSFNLLGGYSAGTEKLEIGGLFNINRGAMTGVQVAGWFNQVGGIVDGVQIAGFVNSNLKSVNGVQVAGFVNSNLDTVKGVQVAGFSNFTTGTVDGVQVAGLVNFTPKKVNGFQGAGLANFTADSLRGTQVAGLVNFVAKDVQGAQVGLVNYARKIKGFQLGFVNYSDSISGVPVGFLSFVRSGYHVGEYSFNEVMPMNFSFRTGKREFYNIFQIGIRPELDDQLTWIFGYGVGTSPRLGKNTFLNIELSSEQMSKGEVEALNLINRFYVGGEVQLSKKLAVFAGPTFSLRVYDTSFEGHPELFTYLSPEIHADRYHPDDLGTQVWWGFRAGLRFF